MLPECPEHPDSSVVKAGFYGEGLNRRQRYWCRPQGDDDHRFTPTLPRLVVEEHTCLECEREVAPHEGPTTVRRYDFPVRHVARALQSVAAGTTYKAASVRIREASGRRGRVPNGQLVADWVEKFAEPLWDEHGPRRWPRVVVCDETTFSVRTIEGTNHQKWPTKRRHLEALPRRDVFTVCAVAGQAKGMPRPKPWFAWAVAGRASKPDWEECFAQLDGRPQVVLADLKASVFNAAEARWPLDTETGETPPRRSYCIHHRRNNFPWPAKLKAALDKPDHPRHDEATQLGALLDRCAYDADAWDALCDHIETALGPKPNKWMRRMNGRDVIREQLKRRRPHNEPVSNSSAEALVRGIKSDFAGRPFTNKARTNRLLKLITLRRRGAAENVAHWAATLRDAAEDNAGRTSGNQRDCCDPSGSPTLH